MMKGSRTEQVKELLSHFEHRESSQVDESLTDDFAFSGPTPEPLTKKSFMDLHTSLINAFPDWAFNAHDFEESGDKVNFKVRITGTNTKELSLPMLGIKAAASNKRVTLAEEKTEIEFAGNQISSYKVEKVDNAGVPGMLAQLGIPMPAPAKV